MDAVPRFRRATGDLLTIGGKDFNGHGHRRPPESMLVKDFIELSKQSGGVIVIHASFKAIRWVVG
jgi:hypothetical protein